MYKTLLNLPCNNGNHPTSKHVTPSPQCTILGSSPNVPIKSNLSKLRKEKTSSN